MSTLLPSPKSSHSDILQVFAPTSTATGDAQRVLVLDVNDFLRQLIVTSLTRAGYVVAAVADDERGWRELHSEHYDLLIADMPRSDGRALAARLQRAGVNVPIILATDSDDSISKSDMDWNTFAAVIYKPFRLGELPGVVRQVLPRPGKSGDEPAVSPVRRWGLNE